MGAPSALSRLGRAYIWVIVSIGLCLIASSVLSLFTDPLPWQWFLLAALTLASSSATINLPSVPASISISETFVFTAVLLYGTAAGTVIAALDGLGISFWIARRRRELHRALFNTSAPALSVWCSASLFFWVMGISPLGVQPVSLDRFLVGLVFFASLYFGLNSWLITCAVVSETGLKPLQVWRENFLWLSLNYFFGASVAFLLVVYTRNIDIRYLGVIVPLLLVLYFTFKTSIARVEDANRHVEKVHRLYLSTIETLAMAIDAKDQITHGHIRRVQTYAIELATRMGLSDQGLINAIEAAALLHDMGKLAVPEYILNKPGKLTSAEFEKMKQHASVGADILSAIDFPYPVVPIVRHHHEHWDGRGYPDGLKGTAIPIGARILAVVDCFDALTSDRPYRPKLTDDEALRIVTERRGTMYDPLIVDTFARVHREIAPTKTQSASQALSEIASSTATKAAATRHRLDDIVASSDETGTMYDLARRLAGEVTVAQMGSIVANHLRRLVPFSLCVFYLYDPANDDLEAVAASGDGASAVKGLRIPLGARLSGWVGANRQTIANSDSTLDLGEVARAVAPRLRLCLSTPLVWDDQLTGVITIYSNSQDGFGDDHRRIVEAVATQCTQAFRTAAELDGSIKHDALTGLPNARRLQETIDNALPNGTGTVDVTLMLIEIVQLEDINAMYGRQVSNEVLRHIAELARAVLRPTDALFRYHGDELIALVKASDELATETIADRICDNVTEHPLSLRAGGTLHLKVVVTTATPPRPGVSLRQAVATARHQNVRNLGRLNTHQVH